MKRRWVIAVALACVMAAVVIASDGPREKEPEYEGKTLSEWIVMSRQTRHPETIPPVAIQARDAVQHIGTNAIPFLLRWTGYEPSGWKRKIRDSLVIGGDNFFTRTFARDYRDGRAARGERGFELLGTNAIIALPELVKRVADQKAPYTGVRAERAMVYLGPEIVLPALAQMVSTDAGRVAVHSPQSTVHSRGFNTKTQRGKGAGGG